MRKCKKGDRVQLAHDGELEFGSTEAITEDVFSTGVAIVGGAWDDKASIGGWLLSVEDIKPVEQVKPESKIVWKGWVDSGGIMKEKLRLSYKKQDI